MGDGLVELYWVYCYVYCIVDRYMMCVRKESDMSDTTGVAYEDTYIQYTC